MGQLTDDTNAWSGSVNQNADSKTYTFLTDSTYVDKDIVFTVEVKHGEIADGGSRITGTNLDLSSVDTSGIAVEGQGSYAVVVPGWVDTNTAGITQPETKYVTGVKVTEGKQFKIDDGINNWTWTVDNDGNVTII